MLSPIQKREEDTDEQINEIKTSYDEIIKALRDDNYKLTKFYNEHKYIEDELLKSKALIKDLLRELNYYKRNSINDNETQINLQANTLISQEELLGCQLSHVQSKVTNISTKSAEGLHKCNDASYLNSKSYVTNVCVVYLKLGFSSRVSTDDKRIKTKSKK